MASLLRSGSNLFSLANNFTRVCLPCLRGETNSLWLARRGRSYGVGIMPKNDESSQHSPHHHRLPDSLFSNSTHADHARSYVERILLNSPILAPRKQISVTP